MTAQKGTPRIYFDCVIIVFRSKFNFPIDTYRIFFEFSISTRDDASVYIKWRYEFEKGAEVKG